MLSTRDAVAASAGRDTRFTRVRVLLHVVITLHGYRLRAGINPPWPSVGFREITDLTSDLDLGLMPNTRILKLRTVLIL